jgi:hypothetical protein
MKYTNKKIAFFVFLVFIASVFAGTYNVIDSYLTVESAPDNLDSQTNEETTTATEETTTEETVATPVQEEQSVADEPETVTKRYGKENHGTPVDERSEVAVKNKIVGRKLSSDIMAYDIYTEVTNIGNYNVGNLIVDVSSRPEGRTIYFTQMQISSLQVGEKERFHTRIFMDDLASRMTFYITADGENIDKVEMEERYVYQKKKGSTTVNHPVATLKPVEEKPHFTMASLEGPAII